MGAFQILLGILGISLLIIIHETGHYLAARAFGMKVIRYSIGLGPTLVKYKPKGSDTTFQVCAIPFLAYVQIAGMNPYEEFEEDDPTVFQNASVTGRVITILAGPFANYLAASIVVFCLALAGTLPAINPEFVTPVTISQFTSDEAPAKLAGLEEGDQIISVEGEAITSFQRLVELTQPRAEQPTTYGVKRDGVEIDPIVITPADVNGMGRIGMIGATVPQYVGVGGALEAALLYPYRMSVDSAKTIYANIRDRDMSGMGSVVKMTRLTARAAEAGVSSFAMMLVLISVALGFFNLLPLPALDGGRLMFLAYEVITRRKPNEKFEMAVHGIGLVLLLGLVVVVTYNDIVEALSGN